MESATQWGADEDFFGGSTLMVKSPARQALFSLIAYMWGFKYTSVGWTPIRTPKCRKILSYFNMFNRD